MLRAAIVERSREKRELIAAAVYDMNMDIQISSYSNKYDFLENLDAGATSFDIVILNTTIHVEGDGITIAQDLRKRGSKGLIAFITESQKYYPEAFSVFAAGYMLYPFEIGELHNCISFFYEKTKKERRASLMIKEKGGSYRRLFTRYITYIESNNREITVHMEDGTTIDSYAKLSEIEEVMPATGQFLRCHQSYIVNLFFVEEYGHGTFTLKGMEIPISRKFQQVSKESYYEYMFEKV